MSDTCPCSFPEDLSWSCVASLARIVTSGGIVEYRVEAAQHAACLLGSLAPQLAGFASTADDCEEEFADAAECAQFVLDRCPEEGAEGFAAAPEGLNLATLLRLLTLVLPLVLGDDE